MKLKKTIASISLIALIMQTIMTLIPEGVLAVENTEEQTNQEEQEVEIGREYEIKEEETWDVSEKQDGSVMAKWTLKDRTLVILGNGKMKDWNYNKSSIDWHNNQYTKYIEKVIIENGVTSIGWSAFSRCSSLTNIEIPEGVTSIEGGVFSECSSLEYINVNSNNKNYMSEDGVLFDKERTTIIRYPERKQNIVEYKIPEGVTSIGYEAFAGCSSLTNITIPDGVTSIEREAFAGCSSLTNITIPDGVTSIEREAFAGCSSLTNITIPEGVTSIELRAFFVCSNLKNITIPEGVTSIESSVFSGCSSLTNITIPDGVTSIEREAFAGCSSLTNITIPEGVTSIGYEAFAGCSSLTNITIPEGVTSIGNYAFKECSSLTNIEIPEGVTSIGNYAFKECSSLTNITIPEGVTSIESSVFSGCSSLTNIIIPEGVTKIGNDAFSKNTILNVKADSKAHEYAEKNGQGYILESKPTVIKTDYEIKKQEKWDISKKQDRSVIARWRLEDRTLIISGNGEMRNWDYNSSIDWHNNQYTEIVGNIIIEEGVTSIGDRAFYGCSSLTNITIPEGVTSIGDYAFAGCSSLTNITIPERVTNIGDSAFYRCSNLANIEIPKGVTNIRDYAFKECSSLTNIIIPEGVTSIGDRAFYGCSSLTNIIIPKGVTSIGNYAFKECSSLTNITILEGVTYIGYEAFEGCSSLENINVNINNKNYMSEKGILFNKDKTEIICYPEGKKDSQEYIIPEGVTSIGDYAFNRCSSLTNITIPEGVTNIGNSAFYECSSLTNIEIPEGVTSIGWSAFLGCSSLTNITIPEGVTSIEREAFDRCSSLTNITIPEGVTSIGYYAFAGCSSLTNIIIPEGVTSIGDDAFDGVKNIIIKKNTEGHRYAEDEKVGYIIDEEGPEITYTPNGSNTPQKQYQIKINVKDIKTEVNENSLKYQWTQSTETPSKESFEDILKNGQTITKDNGDGIWYLWVYAEDKLGNVTIKRSEGYNFDNTAPKVEIQYSSTNPTNENVIVAITSNEEMQEVEGWKMSENKNEITKEYTENKEETVVIKDKLGNQTETKVSVKNIDKVNPVVEVRYSTINPTRENVTVTIVANEEIQEVEGWKMSENKKEITKEYAENTEEAIILKDKVGNQTEVKISIKNIDPTLPEIQIGDINGDKRIDITDLLLLKRHIIAGNKESWKLTGEKLQAGDINEDEDVNITDMLLLKRKIIGKV